MHRHSFVLVLVILFSLVACSLFSVKENPLPAETATPPATEAFEPTNPSPTAASTLTSPPVLTTEWLSQLEVIQAGNWSRLQLLKTFPAEMPLNHSAVAISLDGETMAMGSSSGAEIYFWDLESGDLIQKINVSGVSNPDAYFNTMEYLRDGTLVANSDGPYMIYHMDANGNVLSAWSDISFALSADKSIMAHHTDEGITLVEIANNTPLLSLEEMDGMYFSFSPDGSKIAIETIGVDYVNTVIWDIPNRTRLATLVNTAEARFSPDGKFLAVIHYDYENDTTPLKILNPDGGTEIITLNVAEPNGLSNHAPLWSLDGSVVTAQIANGSPAAWDTRTWEILDAPALQGELYSFSPDGRILVTRESDGSILLWGILP